MLICVNVVIVISQSMSAVRILLQGHGLLDAELINGRLYLSIIFLSRLTVTFTWV